MKCGDSCHCVNCKNRSGYSVPSNVLLHDDNGYNSTQYEAQRNVIDREAHEIQAADEDNKATLMAALAMTSLFSAKVTPNEQDTEQSKDDDIPCTNSPKPIVSRQISTSPDRPY